MFAQQKLKTKAVNAGVMNRADHTQPARTDVQAPVQRKPFSRIPIGARAANPLSLDASDAAIQRMGTHQNQDNASKPRGTTPLQFSRVPIQRGGPEDGANDSSLFTRESFKFSHYPDDSWRTMGAKTVFNTGVDAVPHMVNPVLNYSKGVFKKLPDATLDAFHPKYAMNLLQHPEFVPHYLSQRAHQVTGLMRLYSTPTEYAKEKMHDIGNNLALMRSYYHELDPGFTGSLSHLARAGIDYSQEHIASTLGIGLGGFALFQTPQARHYTAQAMDHLFPSGTSFGNMARTFPMSIPARRFSRVVGNPGRLALLGGYLAANHLGRHQEAMTWHEETHPEDHQRLKAKSSEAYASERHRSFRESIDRTRDFPIVTTK